MTRKQTKLLLWWLAETQSERVASFAAEGAQKAGGPMRRAAWQVLEDIAKDAGENPVRFAVETETIYHETKKRKRKGRDA
jgi:hypothetical protein